MDKRETGAHFESLACDWLEKKGLRTLSRNYHCRYGEIDLVMLDTDACLCFIEVKYRKGSGFGGSAYSLPVAKQRKLTRSALHFIEHNRAYRHHAMRFDALLLQGNGENPPHINWIRNAFYAQ